MSEITQPPPDVQTQDPNSRVNRLNAASDQSSSNKQSAEQQAGKNAAELEPEKQVSHHDPAVTLASTLSKLDSGSYFTATVSGHDADGRTIIASEVGTYLVETEQKYTEDLKKVQTDTALNIRVITIDKEIKAEIVRPPVQDSTSPQIIPVQLTLTDIAGQSHNNIVQTALPKETPLEDVRSQYQATTLYKAERIAREIADKLDNLPLPTSSPNYTVYGSSTTDNDKAANLSPRKFSANVSIQEVAGANNSVQTTAPTFAPQLVLEHILGQNINVQVIKAVPKSPITLPAGLPEAVIKEISALTPLDYVQKGQNLTINVAAIAIPDVERGPTAPVQSAVPPPTPPIAVEITAATTPNIPPLTQKSTPITNEVTQSQVPVKDAVVSGIIIDTTQKHTTTSPGKVEPVATESVTPYSQKNTPQQFGNIGSDVERNANTYYLATPTTVLKLQNNTPLVPGTIVSFTVVSDNQTAPNEVKSDKAARQSTVSAISEKIDTPHPATVTPPAATAQSSPSGTSPPTGSVSPALLDRIEQFIPQELIQLPDDWASISMALAALVASSSQNTAAIMSSRIPNLQSPEQITSTMIFFLSALKASQPGRTWLGPDVSAKLKQLGVAKVIDRIDGDLTRIARLGRDAPIGEWRPLLIPFQNGPEVSAVPMLTRQVVDEDQKKKNQDSDSDGNEIKVKATRFILELKFSQFGMVLVDGLLKEKRLDVILKSANAIPFAVKMKLSRRYNDALMNNGFDGELVVIDNSPSEVSVRKMFETMAHNTKIEKKI